MEQMLAPATWQLGVFEGPDTADFLQRLSTANVRILEPGSQAVTATFLNAQGKIQAAFWLARETPTRFLIASGDLTAVAAFIDRYTFAEKQTFRTLELPRALWIWSETDDVPANAAQATHRMSHGSGTWDAHWVSLWGIEPLATARTLSDESFTARRIQQGVAWWGHEITPETSPLEIHFQDSVAANKGCYPGQEVIERTLAMGAPPRRLCRVSLPPSGQAPEGWIVTTPALENSADHTALALLRKTQAVVGFETDGAQCLEVFRYKADA